MPRWSRVLLVLGVAPWFLARPLIGRRVLVRIPLAESLADRIAKSRADLVAVMAGGLFATIAGAFIPRDDLQVALVAAGFLIVTGSLVALVMGERDYGVDLRPTAWGTVTLRRIHPRFRDALVRGDVAIGTPSIGEIVSSAAVRATVGDPWA